MTRTILTLLCTAILLTPMASRASNSTSEQLHSAVGNDDLDEVRRLLDAGTDVNARTDGGLSALHLAVARRSLEIVQILLSAGADANLREETGYTPLHLANIAPSPEVVQVLLDAGADVNMRDYSGNSPLLTLFTGIPGSPEVARLLLDAGADINARNNEGKTPLHTWAAPANLDAVQMFLDAGADFDARDGRGLTPLHAAVVGGSSEVLSLLLDAGADVDARAGSGLTPLHLAVAGGSSEVSRLLLDAGADLLIPTSDSDFITPLDLAKATQGEEFMRELLGDDAHAWNDEARSKRFKLFNECKPMRVLVGLQLADNEAIPNLTKEAIQAAVESRLRAARLFDDGASSRVFTYVQLLRQIVGGRHSGWVYRIDFEMDKTVWDLISKEQEMVSTWTVGSLGTAPTNQAADAILGTVRGYMDQFLAEYLRVNEKACQ